MVGAAASLGLLVAEPVARLLRGSSLLERLDRPWVGAIVVGVLQLLVVLVTSRVAGLQVEPVLAAVIAALALVTATAIVSAPPWRSTLSRHVGRE